MGFDLHFKVSKDLTLEQKNYLKDQFLIDAAKEDSVPEDVLNFLVDTPVNIEQTVVVKKEISTIDYSELNGLFSEIKTIESERRINIKNNKHNTNTETMNVYTQSIGVAA